MRPFWQPCLRVDKTSCHTIETWCNFERFNTLPNSKILLKLISKMKYLTDQFQTCFCFCIYNIKTLSSYILFVRWQHNWHPYRQLATCYICFVLSLHPAVVSNAAVEWVFNYVTSVFRMWKSYDFECVYDRYQCCVICACFLRCILGPVATPAHGLLRLSPSLRLRFIPEN